MNHALHSTIKKCKRVSISRITKTLHIPVQINALFENRKDNTITISWIEKFSDGRWDILTSTINFERLDAYHAKFNVKIQANSKEEISFKARIEKM